MSRLIDTAGRLKTYLERVGTSTDGLASDVRNQAAAIERYRKSMKGVTPEGDQALREIETINKAMAQKTGAIEEINPPVV